MYEFKIKKQEEGGYRFELEGIRLIVDEYTIQEGKHLLTHPDKAIAYFMIDDNIYGISNDPQHYGTAEAFYDAIIKQYEIFTNDKRSGDRSIIDTDQLKHSA
jgi:hypothetical protein